MTGEVRSLFFVKARRIGYAINPAAIPSAILYVSGINTIINSAEKVSAALDKSISLNSCNIDIPITIKIGAMALLGIKDNTGIKKREAMKNIPVVIVAKPVFAPLANIEPLSSAEIVGLVPNRPDKKAVSELAFKIRGNFSVCFSCLTCPFVRPTQSPSSS